MTKYFLTLAALFFSVVVVFSQQTTISKVWVADNGDGTFGVDLNRNYGFEWGIDDVGSDPFTNSEKYRGVAPFSEPETQVVRDFCLSRQFKTAINAHSYGQKLLYPWSYQPRSALAY